MGKIKKIVIASRNIAKIEHYRKVFTGLVDTILSLTELGIDGKPSESGETAEANAEIKARFYHLATGLPVFSEDEALYADFLSRSQQPGTHVRRINRCDEVSDKELIAHWEKLIRPVPEKLRNGHWHFAYCLVKNNISKTITRDFPVHFFYPASALRIPDWPLSSLQGGLGKPHSEYTPQERHQLAIRDTKVMQKMLKDLLSI